MKTSESNVINRGMENEKEDIEAGSIDESQDKKDEIRPFKFSLRKLWAFAGPGWLMSIAYLDPGNSKIYHQVEDTIKLLEIWMQESQQGIGCYGR